MREDTNHLLNNISFFMNSEVDNWLSDQFERREDAGIQFSVGDDFSCDVIDQPFHIAFRSVAEETSVFLYIRSELGMYTEETANLTLTIYSNGDDPKVTNRGGIGGDLSATIIHFLKTGVQLRHFVLKKNL